MRTWMALLGLVLLPVSAHAESWAFLGLRDREGPPVAGKLETARRIFESSLPEGDGLLPPEEFARRLGLREGKAPDPEEALAEAELLFFQLEYQAARAKLEAAIDAVARGQASASPELGRSLRLLLAHIHLQEPGGKARAEDAIRLLASLSPLPASVRRTVGAEVAALWDEVRAATAARAEGWLIVDCTGCHGGEVWLEGVAVGTTQQSIGLSPGTYHLILRGLSGSEGKRSLAREVQILPGKETRILIDLGAEATLVAADGPALIDEGEVSFRRAAYLAERIGIDRLLAWRFGEAAIEVREVGAGGVRATWTREVEGGDWEGAVDQLVDSVLGRSVAPAEEGGFAPAAPHLYVRQEDSPGWRPIAKWGGVGATVVMAGIASWLTADGASARAELGRLESRTGSYISPQEGRRAEELAGIVESRQDWSTVFWTGAAVGAVGTLLLFLDVGAGDP